MVVISYAFLMASITCCWFLFRIYRCCLQKKIIWIRELQLILVYICIVVIARFTFFPFSKVNGMVQPLVFDPALALPFRINWIPLVNLLDYEIYNEGLLNIIGNIAMFIPVGIIWPFVFRPLQTPERAIAAGFGYSLCIEILQLPFYDRVSDVDDLILNTASFAVGHLIYALTAAVTRLCRKK